MCTFPTCFEVHVLVFELKDNGAGSITAYAYKVGKKPDELRILVTGIQWSERRIGIVCSMKGKQGTFKIKIIKVHFSTALTWRQNFQRLQSITSLAFYHSSLLMLPRRSKLWRMCLSTINKPKKRCLTRFELQSIHCYLKSIDGIHSVLKLLCMIHWIHLLIEYIFINIVSIQALH